MAGVARASLAENNGSYDSENGNKRVKSNYDEEEKEDRISSLPDFLIHQILSVLPATDLIKTMVLSKWWNYQWTHVPVLNFIPKDGMSPDQFSNFIDKTLILHDCSSIHKFVINLNPFSRDDEFPDLDLWIRFAVRKDVKELIVNFNNDLYHHTFPQFVFNCSSLVTVELCRFFMRIEKVNWGSVKSLCLHHCAVGYDGIAKVLSGCPLLEHLELQCCDLYKPELVIASKSLKTLVMDSIGNRFDVIEISCLNVERLRVSGLACFPCLKLMNLPSSVYATLDFYIEENDFDEDMSYDDYENLVLQTLMQVLHVEKLEIGSWLMEILSSSKEDGDCIGGLPDSFIHRMLSFLPPKKDAFESDLYKDWKPKWTDVPILKFVSNEKFIINSKDIPLMHLDPRLSLWIRLAVKKDIKELILDCNGFSVEYGHEYPLPQFLFNNSSLVKMKLCTCDFMPSGKVNWESLKSLQLDHSFLNDKAIENVLSGSPLLERLELRFCVFEGAVVVASERLKTFLLDDFGKKCSVLEISCPNLERLKIWGNLGSASLKLMNLPSQLHAILDFYILESDDMSPYDCINSLEEIKKQIMHVEELRIKLSSLRIQLS